MLFPAAFGKLKRFSGNRDGFTLLIAVFMVTIVGILSALTGKSWTMIMKREREKELLFRGSQIKEAIENWYNPKYSANGLRWQGVPRPLMNLEDLLENPYVPGLKYLPQSYATELDDKNPRCAPDCATKKIFQDPITGKQWTILRGSLPTTGGTATVTAAVSAGTPGGNTPIIGVASKSDDTPVKTDFRDTALENMANAAGAGSAAGGTVAATPHATVGTVPSGMTPPSSDIAGKMGKYSDWKFMAESPEKNDHKKIYRAYHEGW